MGLDPFLVDSSRRSVLDIAHNDLTFTILVAQCLWIRALYHGHRNTWTCFQCTADLAETRSPYPIVNGFGDTACAFCGRAEAIDLEDSLERDYDPHSVKTRKEWWGRTRPPFPATGALSPSSSSNAVTVEWPRWQIVEGEDAPKRYRLTPTNKGLGRKKLAYVKFEKRHHSTAGRGEGAAVGGVDGAGGGRNGAVQRCSVTLTDSGRSRRHFTVEALGQNDMILATYTEQEMSVTCFTTSVIHVQWDKWMDFHNSGPKPASYTVIAHPGLLMKHVRWSENECFMHGLEPYTRYHFQIIANNEYGSSKSVMTSTCTCQHVMCVECQMDDPSSWAVEKAGPGDAGPLGAQLNKSHHSHKSIRHECKAENGVTCLHPPCPDCDTCLTCHGDHTCEMGIHLISNYNDTARTGTPTSGSDTGRSGGSTARGVGGNLAGRGRGESKTQKAPSFLGEAYTQLGPGGKEAKGPGGVLLSSRSCVSSLNESKQDGSKSGAHKPKFAFESVLALQKSATTMEKMVQEENRVRQEIRELQVWLERGFVPMSLTEFRLSSSAVAEARRNNTTSAATGSNATAEPEMYFKRQLDEAKWPPGQLTIGFPGTQTLRFDVVVKGGESKARKRLKRALMRVVAIVAMRGITNVFDQSKGTVSKWKKVKDRFDVQSGLGAKYHTKQKVNRAAFRTTDVGLIRPLEFQVGVPIVPRGWRFLTMTFLMGDGDARSWTSALGLGNTQTSQIAKGEGYITIMPHHPSYARSADGGPNPAVDEQDPYVDGTRGTLGTLRHAPGHPMCVCVCVCVCVW